MNPIGKSGALPATRPPLARPAPLLLCCSVRPQIASALEESGV